MPKDPFVSIRKYIEIAHPPTKSDFQKLHAHLTSQTNVSEVSLTVRRDGKEMRDTYTRKALEEAVSNGWDNLEIVLEAFNPKDHRLLDLWIHDNGTRVRILVQAPNDAELNSMIADTLAVFPVKKLDDRPKENPESEGFVGVAVTPNKLRRVIEVFNNIEQCDLEVLERGKRHWQTRPISLADLLQMLENAEKFQTLLQVRGSASDGEFNLRWDLKIPLGWIWFSTSNDPAKETFKSLFAILDSFLNFKKVDQNKDRYRTGTLNYEIQRWSEERFHAAMAMVHHSFTQISATPEQITRKTVVPDPLVTTAYVTREGKPAEGFDGPVEVLEAADTMEGFFDLIGQKVQILRAFSLSLEGPLAYRLNLSANLRDNRIEFWGTQDLKQLQTLIDPLVVGLHLKLVEGRPGMSLKEKPDFLEKASTRISQLQGLGLAAVALVTTLGISVVSTAETFLIGHPLVEATHPVKNEAVFEGQETTALSLKWNIQSSLMRQWINVLPGEQSPGDALDIVVYKNGEQQADLSKRAVPGVTLQLDTGKYRIDFDHPTPGVRDATIYVNIADPNAPVKPEEEE